MGYDLNNASRGRMRRADRRVDDDEWIRRFLERCPVGSLATVHDGQPYINTNIFAYDRSREFIYVHTARVGRTRWNLERDARVCFSVGELGRILPADTAMEFSLEYAGVTVFGVGRVLEEPGEKRRGLELLMNKYAPHLRLGEDYRAITDGEMSRTSVFGIEIEEWTGKRKVVEPDFPGAFDYWEQAGLEDGYWRD